MSLLLINAYFGENDTEPLGLCYIASYLRKNGHNVNILNPNLTGMSVNECFESFEVRNYSYIGISVVDQYREEAYKIIHAIRNNGFKGIIFVGGPSATISPEEYLSECDSIDFVSLGEGEETILELMEKGSYDDLDGIAFIVDDELIKRKRKSYLNIDNLPFPSRDILDEKYLLYGERTEIDILSSRGCVGNCSFCSAAKLYGEHYIKKYRFRSIRNIVEEIEMLVYKYKIKRFRFSDDSFVLKGEFGTKRLKDFARLLDEKKLKIEFKLYARIDALTSQKVDILLESGMSQLFIGVESINNDDLKIFNKSIDTDMIMSCLQMLTEKNVRPDVRSKHRLKVGYITFHPFVTIESLRKSYEFCRKNNFPFVKLLNKVILFKGTELRNQTSYANLLDGNDYRFKDEIVGHIYLLTKTLLSSIRESRDQLRSIEKIPSKNNLLMKRVTESRICLDNLAYDIFREIVMNYRLSMNLDSYQEELSRKVENHIINLKLHEIMKDVTRGDYGNINSF